MKTPAPNRWLATEMNCRPLAITLCLVGLTFGCSVSERAWITPLPSQTQTGHGMQLREPTDEQFNVAEVVLKSMFASPDFTEKHGFRYFFVSLGGSDPPVGFLSRFKTVHLPVLACSSSEGSTDGIFKKGTREKGIAYSVMAIRTIGDRYEVVAIATISGLAAAEELFSLARDSKGKWVVTGRKTLSQA